MGRILSVIRAKSSLECLPCDRVNLDFGNFGDYQDAGEHPAERQFERPPLPANRRDLTEVPSSVPSILGFFLDGSRRTYKIADIILDGRHYLPVVAGQIGVAVVERSDNGKTVQPLRRFCRFVNAIAFPDSIESDELNELQTEVNRHVPVPFKLLRYQAKPDDPSRDPAGSHIRHALRTRAFVRTRTTGAPASRCRRNARESADLRREPPHSRSSVSARGGRFAP